MPTEDIQISACPCCSGEPYAQCCGPLHGGQHAATALALMRSRYTAYVQQKIDYILQTSHPAMRDSVDRASTLDWARDARWLGLSILATLAGGLEDREGVVEFVARYELLGQVREHRERSLFRKQNGVWYYVEGTHPGVAAPRAPAPAPRRNSICACGSGKKYKRCHGA